MRPLRFGLPGLVVVLLVAVPVMADNPGAPPGQYEPFDHLVQRIRDQKTGLNWERVVPGAVAFGAVSCPVIDGTPTRLPTLKELLTLVDEQPHTDYDVASLKNVQKSIDPNAFGSSTPVDQPYWTSSAAGDRIWVVDFKSGETFADDKAAKRYARCVSFAPP